MICSSRNIRRIRNRIVTIAFAKRLTKKKIRFGISAQLMKLIKGEYQFHHEKSKIFYFH
jgi:hypothetical protein